MVNEPFSVHNSPELRLSLHFPLYGSPTTHASHSVYHDLHARSGRTPPSHSSGFPNVGRLWPTAWAKASSRRL